MNRENVRSSARSIANLEFHHAGDEVNEVARRIVKHLGKPRGLITLVPDRPGHDRRYLLDHSKITAELGWEPLVKFEDGLPQTVQWYAENREWWEPLKDRAPVDETSNAWK